MEIYIIFRGSTYMKTCSSLELAKKYILDFDNVLSYEWITLLQMYCFPEDQINKEGFEWSIIKDTVDAPEIFHKRFTHLLEGDDNLGEE